MLDALWLVVVRGFVSQCLFWVLRVVTRVLCLVCCVLFVIASCLLRVVPRPLYVVCRSLMCVSR